MWRSKGMNFMLVPLMLHFGGHLRECVYLDAVFGSLLQVWYDRVVPQVNEPLPELCHWYWTRQEEAGAWGRQNVTLNDFLLQVQLPPPFRDHVSAVSYLWGSLKCCASPGKCGGGTTAEAPSPVREGEPVAALSPAPSPGRLPQLYGAGTSAGTR